MLIILSVSLITLGCLLYLYFTRTYDYWKSRNVVGPKPVPFYGNIMDSTLRKKPIMPVIRDIYEAYPNEKVVGVFRMTTPNLLIRDPEIVKTIMIKDFDKFVDRGIEFSKEGMGVNLFHADGDTWRVLRTRFTPLFTSGKLKNMFHLMTERADNFMDHAEQLIKYNSEQEVFQLLQKFTMSVIAACAFGLDIDTTKESDIFKTMQEMDKKIFTINFAHELDMMYPGIFKSFTNSLFPASVTKFFYDLVSTCINQRQGKPTNRKDFMDCILELKQAGQVTGRKRNEGDKGNTLELTDNVLAAQAFVFFAAGYETSTTTMTFVMYLLALHPEIQEKVYAEIKEVLARHDGKVSYDGLMELNYLEKVFDETLRLYPIIDPLQRNAVEDYKIPGTNVTVKKGQTILVSVGGLHNDAKYWPNPSKFDPERFSPENSANRHSAAYVPFGIGPRNCIGMRFAKLSSRLALVRLLLKYRLEPTEHTRRDFTYNPYRLVLSPQDGFKMNLVQR